MGQADSAMNGTSTPAGSRCICRCQLLGGYNTLRSASSLSLTRNTDNYNYVLVYGGISVIYDENDGGIMCCTACYAMGYK